MDMDIMRTQMTSRNITALKLNVDGISGKRNNHVILSWGSSVNMVMGWMTGV